MLRQVERAPLLAAPTTAGETKLPLDEEKAWDILGDGIDLMMAAGDLRLSDYCYVRDKLFDEPKLPPVRSILRRFFRRKRRVAPQY